MGSSAKPNVDRPVRVAVPVAVDFSGVRFLIREFTANLSVGGVFLPTEESVEPGTDGWLTFRLSHWDEPFRVRARVVHAVSADDAGDRRAGLGIQFIDLGDKTRKKLQRLVDGIQDGSVVQAIRRSIREGGRSLLDEIRRRPVDQRLMLALQASGEEIDALIRDGNDSVVERLLDNPRLHVRHVRAISGDPRLRTATLMALRRLDRWFADEDVRFNFCMHRSAPLDDVLRILPRLTTSHLQRLSTNGNLRPQIRVAVKDLLRKRGSASF